MKLLIVDDNQKFVERMTGMLEHLEFVSTIRVAHEYDTAYHRFLDEIPDVVLLDINLPGKNGIELLRKIHQAGWNCEVIMLTNNANEYYRQLCTSLGALFFLDKTIEFGRVPKLIRQISMHHRPMI